MLTNEIKHSISVKFVDGMNSMNNGEMTLAEFLSMVDQTAREHPGDERQQRFYGAVRELAAKVDDAMKELQEEKAND